MDIDKNKAAQEISEMQEETESNQLKKTELTWDKYMDYLVEAIDESNFMKRGEIKPMATPKDDLESHLTSRTTHVRIAANIAKRIAKQLNLNYRYAYAGMLMHDAGHPFSAHEGEDGFTDIGRIFNVQYFHHNAKGVEVVASENVCERAIAKIPNIKNRPELAEKLRKEFFYLLDVIISHDGEASPREMTRKATTYSDIETAVKDKLKRANATNDYKFVAQTPEGTIAKFADVIAYLATDMQDGFRLGIYRDFPEEFLELFGEMYAEDYATTKEEKIQVAKNIIEKIKEKKLRELVQDVNQEENREIIKTAQRIVKEITDSDIKFETEEGQNAIKEILGKHIDQFKEKNTKGSMSLEEKAFLNSDVQKIKEFTGKLLRVRSGVVTEVTTEMQEFFINDLLKNSTRVGQLEFSPAGKALFFKAKQINYNKYVPKTKWEYQQTSQPMAAYQLVDLCARGLRKSGAIVHKFYDRTMRKHITNPEILEYLNVRYAEQGEYDKFKEAHGIRDIKSPSKSNKRFTNLGAINKDVARRELLSNVYEYVQNEGELFAIRCENTFGAIENQMSQKLSKALDPYYEIKGIKAAPQTFKETVSSEIDKEIDMMRQRFIKQYGDLENATDEQKEKFKEVLIREEKKKLEEKMAIQLAIDYISGMTDKGFNEIAVQMGFMKREELYGNRVDPNLAKQNPTLKKLAEDMTLTDGEGERRD